MFGLDIFLRRARYTAAQWRWLSVAWTMMLLCSMPLLHVLGILPPGLHWYHFLPALAAFISLIISYRTVGNAMHKLLDIESRYVNEYIDGTVFSTILAAAFLVMLNVPWQLHLSWEIILFAFLSSYVQELIFREYLLLKTRQLGFSKIFAILLNATIFSYIHIFYNGEWRTALLLMTFLYAIVISVIYIRKPSVMLATLSHTCVNLLLATTGIFW